jgi:sec-independent protein translocase protein TatA
MFGIGQPELLIIIFIVLLFFGPSSLPKLSKTLGESAKSLRDGFTDGKNDKSLKDITQEMTNSARDIKRSIIDVKTDTLANNDPVTDNPESQPKDI